MVVRSHRFISYSFKNFELAKVVRTLAASPTKTVPKDAFFQKHPDRPGGVFAYNFGALTFWNLDADEIQKYLDLLRFSTPDGLIKESESDDYLVEEGADLKPHAEFNKLVLDELTDKRAEVVALTLGQSVTMSMYENLVDTIWISVTGLVNNLKKRAGRVRPSPRKFHHMIADALSARNNVIGILHLLDRPDIIWDDKTMDSLYSDLRNSFDLEERFRAIEYKLGSIQDTMELLIDMARDSRLFLVEIAIVFLILLELILSLFR